MKSQVLETWVGAIVLGVAAVFLFYAYGHAELDAPRGGYELNAKFGRIDGITTGTDVRLAGVKIGVVADQKLDPVTYQADVALSIQRSVDIPEDSVAKVTLDGLLGGAHISIEPGGSDVMLAEGEEFLFTQGSVDFIGLATRAFLSSSGGEAQTTGGPSPDLPDL